VGVDELGLVGSAEDAAGGPRDAVVRLLHQLLLQLAPIDARRGAAAAVLRLAGAGLAVAANQRLAVQEVPALVASAAAAAALRRQRKIRFASATENHSGWLCKVFQ